MVLDIIFTEVNFVKKSVLGGDVYFGGCCPVLRGVFLWCLFSDVPSTYDAFSLYSQFNRSLLVLSRDVVK